MPATITMGTRPIGAGEPVLIIAEAGVNHNGSLTLAHQMVASAAAAGADVVKFQAFRPAELCLRESPLPAYAQSTGHADQRAMLERLHLAPAGLKELSLHAQEHGLDFLCSVFDETSLADVLAVGASAIKFASTDLTNWPLLSKAARTKIPLFLSTGAAHPSEVADTLARLTGVPILLFHCTSSYPSEPKDANLTTLGEYARRFSVPIGYSDHTLGTETAPLAVAAGACAIEKHFTLDPSLPGPDHALSLPPDEFAAMVRAIRDAEVRMGSPRTGVLSCEEEVRRLARRSLVTRWALPAGHVIEEEDLVAKRPGMGIGPEEIDRVVRRRLRHAVLADFLLTPEDLE